MRLAHFTTYTSRLNGGVFFVLTALLPRLRAAGLDARVFGYQDARTEEDRARWGGVPVEAFAPWPPRVFGFAPGFGAAVRRFQPGLIHTHGLWTYLSWVALQEHRRARVPLVISPHGMLDAWALARSPRKKRLVGRLFQDRQLDAAAAVHALTPAEARAVRDYGCRAPVVVIPNGVDPDPVRPAASAPWAGHAIADRPNVLLFLGRLHRQKGLVELLEAWARWQAQPGPSRTWALAIAGWDEIGLEGSLRESVAARGLDASVMFCGPLVGEAKAAALAHAAGFALPSHSEGLPMAVLEAWSYGLPVILTPACNLPEGVARGAALACDAEPASIARALGELDAAGPGGRNAMGAAGQALVRERFDWTSIAGDFRRLYAAIAAGAPPPDDLRMA